MVPYPGCHTILDRVTSGINHQHMGRTAVDNARSMVSGAGDPAFLVDMEGKLLAWNSAATDLFGVAPWQASSHPCSEAMRNLRRQGEAACSADCPILAGLVHGSIPAAIDVILQPTGLPLSIHHVAVWNERNRPVAVLHLVGAGRPVPSES